MIQLRTFGALDLRGPDGTALQSVLAQPKRFALLVYLACAEAGTFQRRDTLLGLFWPELETSRARNALNQALHYLRRSLGHGTILTRGDEVGIDAAALRCDATLLESIRPTTGEVDLVAALEPYRGEFLPGFYIGDAPGFERWVETARARYARVALHGIWRLIEAAEARGDIETARAWVPRALEVQPVDEDSVRRAIEFHGRIGDLTAAVRVYEALARNLAEEFDAEPSERTRATLELVRTEARSGWDADAADELRSDIRDGLRADAAVGLPGDAADGARGEAVGGARGDAAGGAHGGSRDRGADGAGSAPASMERARPEPARPAGPDGGGARLRLAHRSTGGRWVARVAVAVVLIAGVGRGALKLWPGDTSAELSALDASAEARTVVVLPFTIRGDAAMDYLARGMPDLLSATLRGVPGLRPTDPRAAVGTIGGRAPADLDQARRAAERLGAGRFVVGDVVVHAGRLQIDAAIYDRHAGSPITQATVQGEADELFDLVDRLAADLLTGLLHGPSARLSRLAASTSPSLPALKAFIHGESELRAGRYGTARDLFEQAVALDTTFALAYYRLAVAAGWTGPGSAAAARAAEGALRHDARLADHDRLLLRAFHAYIHRDAIEAERLYRLALASRADDVEAWYQLGEVQFHYGPLLGRPLVEARAAFERVLAMVPDHGESMMHLARIAALERDPAAFDDLAHRYMAAGPGPDHALEIEAMRAYAFGDAAARQRIEAELGGLGDHSLLSLINVVAVYTENLEAAAVLARVASRLDRSLQLRALGHAFAAQFELGRGRWREALRELDALEPIDPGMAEVLRAWFAASSFSSASPAELIGLRERAEQAEPIIMAAPMIAMPLDEGRLAILYDYLRGMLGLRTGDRLAAERIAADLEAVGGTRGDPYFGVGLAHSLRASSAWAAGDLSTARRQLERVPFGPQQSTAPIGFFAQSLERFLWGEILAAQGEHEEALRWYGSFPEPGGYDAIHLAPAHLRRAELWHDLGDLERAAYHYARFLEIWRDADPELSPVLEKARHDLQAIHARGADRLEPRPR